MTILVTGATGFIGRHLIERLAHKKDEIRALAFPGEDTRALDHFGVEIVRGDVLDYSSLERAASNCRLIFHLAARTEVSGPSRNMLEKVNIEGTSNIGKAALSAGVDRLVFCSSGALYGRDIKNRAIREDTVPTPDSPYGRSKFLAEQVLLSHYKQHGLSVILARTSAVFGPGAMSWLSLFRTIAAGRFRLIGSGNNHHHVADIADIAEGLALCGSVTGIDGRTYILAGSESVQLRDLAHMIGEQVGGHQLSTHLPAWPFYLYEKASRHMFLWTGHRLPRADRIDLYLGDRAFDLSRTRQELGYMPRVSTKEAVRRTAGWFKEHGYI